MIEEQGLPVYDAEEYRERRMAELDTGVQTGLVPPRLADRWERQLENVAWWRFSPTVTHGDLGEHQIVVSEGIVAGIGDWMDARVADPADDLAWLAAAAPDDVFEAVIEAYTMYDARCATHTWWTGRGLRLSSRCCAGLPRGAHREPPRDRGRPGHAR